jgi:hypothetical protein
MKQFGVTLERPRRREAARRHLLVSLVQNQRALCLLSATMNCGNDDPDRVGHLRGMGDRGSGPGSRAGLRTGSDFTAQRPFNSLIIVNKNVDKTFSTTDEAACPQKYARPAMNSTAIKSRAASARTTKKRGCKSNAGSDVPQ